MNPIKTDPYLTRIVDEAIPKIEHKAHTLLHKTGKTITIALLFAIPLYVSYCTKKPNYQNQIDQPLRGSYEK